MEITYTRKGDCLYPNLALDPADNVEIGKYGQMRWHYLREHREAMYWGISDCHKAVFFHTLALCRAWKKYR